MSLREMLIEAQITKFKRNFTVEKKRHTIKNNLITEDSQYIVYLSQTYEGTVHDKKICDIENYCFPNGLHLRYDLGFSGYAPKNITIEKPHKKTKLNPLTRHQKTENKEISSKRVSIEQAISGVKRLRIVGDKIRDHCSEFRNNVMILACAIHNFRVRSHARAYACTRLQFQTL